MHVINTPSFLTKPGFNIIFKYETNAKQPFSVPQRGMRTNNDNAMKAHPL